MTYGWAILIILIAVGALFYLGVFSPSTPSTCTATAPITCTDVKAVDSGGTTDDEVSLVIGAATSSSARVTSMTVNSVNNVTGTTTTGCVLPANTIISTTTPGTITLICKTGTLDLEKGDKFSGTATTSYTLSGSTITHTNTIQFSGTVE